MRGMLVIVLTVRASLIGNLFLLDQTVNQHYLREVLQCLRDLGVISHFRRGVNEIFALVGLQAAHSSFLPTFDL
jgi:hypothetical protein